MRRLEQQDDIRWHLQAFGFVERAIVQLDNQDAIGKLLGHQVEKNLKAISVEVNEFKEKWFPVRGSTMP